jgi:carnitine O-acetyltransferase
MKTFENQDKLPRLPVPSLEDTLKTYFKSLEPFLTPEELQQHSLVLKDFATGLGPILQQRLIAYDKTQKNSWLEKWWLEYAYLSWRNSVMVHSNWFLLTNTPKDAKPPNVYQEGYTKYQINRAAGYASNFINYKDLIENELLPPSVTSNGPLDMNQDKKIFGVTRVPKPGCDIIVESFPCKAHHIILLIKDQMFSVNVYDKSGARLKIKDIEKQFIACVEMTEKGKVEEPVCILSAQHRDDWARDHGHLLSLGRNKDNLTIIETALFSVALDHKLLPAGNTNLASTFQLIRKYFSCH